MKVMIRPGILPGFHSPGSEQGLNYLLVPFLQPYISFILVVSLLCLTIWRLQACLSVTAAVFVFHNGMQQGKIKLILFAKKMILACSRGNSVIPFNIVLHRQKNYEAVGLLEAFVNSRFWIRVTKIWGFVFILSGNNWIKFMAFICLKKIDRQNYVFGDANLYYASSQLLMLHHHGINFPSDIFSLQRHH